MKTTKVVLLIVLAFLLVAATAANADTIQVQTGTTKGCFAKDNSGCNSYSTNPTLYGDYEKAFEFKGAAAGPKDLVNGATLNLGSFSLYDVEGNYNPWKFSALITFLLPPGAGSEVVTADLSGLIEWTGSWRNGHYDGTVEVDWDHNVIPVDFNGGSFNLYLRDLTLDVNDCGSVNWVATIGDLKVNAVPEPATMLLLGSGLLMGGIGRKFRLGKKA